MANGTTNAAFSATNVYISGANKDQMNAASYYQTSARKFKTKITEFTKSAIDICNNTKIVEFYYKNDLDTLHIGFIADDTPEELSTKNKNMMDTNSAIGVLIKAVQELEDRIKQLEGK
jgi:ribosome biogenesis protein Nip4